MKIIMLSGPDGIGKSTIIESTRKSLQDRNINSKVIWLRFHHYFSKVVNLFGRLIGKSYYEKHTWGKIGYHNYSGLIGYFYILAVHIDHIIFRIFQRPIVLRKGQKQLYLIDRYILDVAADLIVDTNRTNIIFWFFNFFIKKELQLGKALILECPKEIVIKRRVDISDDKKYDDKIQAYDLIAQRYNIRKLNTGKHSIDEIVSQIVNELIL